MKIKILTLVTLATIFSGCQRDWLDYSPIDMYSSKIDFDDSTAPKRLNVAAATISPDKADKAATLTKMQNIIEKIKSEHADIQVIVFGELILEWYYDEESPTDYQREMSETVPGVSTNFIANLASENNVTLVFGITELDATSDKIYNTQVLIRPNGELIKYRKQNLNDIDIENGMTAGTEAVFAEIDGVKVALFVCSDMQSAEVSKQITDEKVDVVLHSLTSTTDMNAEISYVGLQLNTWIVFSNRFGNENVFNYTGFAHIINPAGTICERSTGENEYVYRSLGIFNK
jgi:predicted amidohydrolase